MGKDHKFLYTVYKGGRGGGLRSFMSMHFQKFSWLQNLINNQ